ncbi:MAG: integron integrase, partial [Acidimicrobiia bacterium]|nr:integron integrase [Acidimicrobiia bacterium]
MMHYSIFHSYLPFVSMAPQLGEGHVNTFLTHLAVKEDVAASTQNQALAALLFLYQHVLEQP